MRCSHCLHTGTRWLLVAATRERCPACTVAAASVGPNHPALAAAAAEEPYPARRGRTLPGPAAVLRWPAHGAAWLLEVAGGAGRLVGLGVCLGHPWITAKVASLTAARTLHSLAALYRRLTKGLCHDMAAAGTCARSMRHAFGRLPCACPLPLLQCSLGCVSHCLQQEQGIQKGMQFGSAQCLGGSEGVTGGRPGVRAVQPSVWDARGDVQVDRPGSCKGAWVDGAAVSWQLRAHPQPGGRRQGCK